jgi:hypothetical protein
MKPKVKSDYFQMGLDVVLDTQCVSCDVRIEISGQFYMKGMLGKMTGNRDIH